jgi:hypothetical protein
MSTIRPGFPSYSLIKYSLRSVLNRNRSEEADEW